MPSRRAQGKLTHIAGTDLRAGNPRLGLGTKTNPRLVGMRCLRCGRTAPVADYFEGCPRCLEAGFPSSVAAEYCEFPSSVEPIREWLAYLDYPSLGEGRTPLVALTGLADELGVATLHLKNEGANPTGSHKDRMSGLVVQRAMDVGASTVVAASSGNAGVSLAAYAANAGLDCVIVTTPDMNANWRHAIEMLGATLLAAETPEQRWLAVAKRVRAGDWYPATNYLVPAVGSNPFGVDGYRSIALELFLQLEGRLPSDIVVPTSRADLLWGIARGYADLEKAGLTQGKPRIHAVEPFPRIARVLAQEDYRGTFAGTSKLVSIGGSTVTYQALDALDLCCGTAVVANEDGALRDQRQLARQGFYLELSSAAALTGLRNLVAIGTVASNASPVLIATARGVAGQLDDSRPIERIEI
jgi:threonine synthase